VKNNSIHKTVTNLNITDDLIRNLSKKEINLLLEIILTTQEFELSDDGSILTIFITDKLLKKLSKKKISILTEISITAQILNLKRAVILKKILENLK